MQKNRKKFKKNNKMRYFNYFQQTKIKNRK